jgi:hypothetical protein
MDNAGNIMDRQELPVWVQAARSEFELRTEVAFWRELIRESAGALPHGSMERMQQALALAESRLRQLHTGNAAELR